MAWRSIQARHNNGAIMSGYGHGPARAGVGVGTAGHAFAPAAYGYGKRRKLITNPLAVNAASRLYASALPSLISGRNGGTRVGVKQARNDALKLIYAGRIQGQVL